ncbi:PREDICTED: linker for activation of T-cells family member 2 [Apaloderma vittatum]|uniref:linker for activation of T-cells family member 2 n=1 Tax=Apaloderma vittatum TaxID=57397 RepID=UPI000521B705|nr:PREDICTED: linker for activation of T-cells family member 2 [Apaloderma vittatum]
MVQPEMLWAAAALMLLGAAVSLCVKCQQSGSRTETRYQNFLTEDYLQGDADYVEPVAMDYYNCTRFFTPPNEKEEDSYSYQNVIIGVSHSSDPVTDDTVDYENSVTIHTWELHQAEDQLADRCFSLTAQQAESSDDEPEYINTTPASSLAPLSKQR